METTKISEASAMQTASTWCQHAETESTLILLDFTLNVLTVENYQTDRTTEVIRGSFISPQFNKFQKNQLHSISPNSVQLCMQKV
jgi:hypothetical protein